MRSFQGRLKCQDAVESPVSNQVEAEVSLKLTVSKDLNSDNNQASWGSAFHRETLRQLSGSLTQDIVRWCLQEVSDSNRATSL